MSAIRKIAKVVGYVATITMSTTSVVRQELIHNANEPVDVPINRHKPSSFPLWQKIFSLIIQRK